MNAFNVPCERCLEPTPITWLKLTEDGTEWLCPVCTEQQEGEDDDNL